MGLVIAVKSLWNSETIENYEEIIMFNPELVQAWANIENGKLKKRVTEAVNSAKGGSTLKKQYETPKINLNQTKSNTRTLQDMTDILKGKERD